MMATGFDVFEGGGAAAAKRSEAAAACRPAADLLGSLGVVVYSPGVGEGFPPLPRGGVLGLDVESTFMDDRAQFSPDFAVRSVQLATKDRAWVLRMDDPSQLNAAVAVLADPAVSFVTHTPMDCLAVWAALGVDVVDRCLDTYELSRDLVSDSSPDGSRHYRERGYSVAKRGRDLKSLCLRYGMPELSEAEQNLDAVFSALWRYDQESRGVSKLSSRRVDRRRFGFDRVSLSDPDFVVYAALDAVCVRRLAECLLREHSRPFVRGMLLEWRSVVRRRIAGLRVDTQWLRSNLESEGAKSAGLAAEFAKITGGVSHTRVAAFRAWAQSAGAVFGAAYPRTKGGAPSMSKEHAAELRCVAAAAPDAAVGEAVELFLELAETKNLLAVYTKVKSMLCPDERIRPWVVVNGTRTSRMASRGGLNVQNFKKDDPRLRGLIIPDAGKVFVSGDFSQVELRVAAAVAREPRVVEAIRAGEDLHQVTADSIGKPRDVGKKANLSALYGIGARLFAADAGIGFEEARSVLHGFWSGYPRINSLRRRLEGRDVVLPDGYTVSTTPTRPYTALNSMIQGSARALLTVAWQRLEAGFPGCVVAPVHDELLIEVPAADASRAVEALKRAMSFGYMGVPIGCEAKVLVDGGGVSRWGL